MSDEDPTKRFDAEDRTTQPMLETLLREFRAFRAEMIEFRSEMIEFRTETVNQLKTVNIRLDRVESLAHQSRADVLALRADFAEIREALPVAVKR